MRSRSQPRAWFLPLLHSFNLIEHSDDSDWKLGRTCFRLGSQQTWYRWHGKSQASLGRLAKLTMAGDALARTLAEPPKTCSEWAQKCQQWQEALHPIRAPNLGKQSSYTTSWVFRVAAISRMRASGLQESRCPKGGPALSLREFAAAFPDQKCTMVRLARHLRRSAAPSPSKGAVRSPHATRKVARGQKSLRSPAKASRIKTVGQLQKALQTSCPLELLTCKLCLASSCTLRQFSDTYIRQNQAALDACMQKYRSYHGLWPSPGILLSGFKASPAGGRSSKE